MNAIPRSGGNRFSGSVLVNGSRPSLQGSNLTDRLIARGLTGATTSAEDAPRHQRRASAVRSSSDKVWFFVTSRYFTNEYYLAGDYFPVDADGGAAARTT